MKNIELINELMNFPPDSEVEMYRDGENCEIHFIFVSKEGYPKPYILFTGKNEGHAEEHETLIYWKTRKPI